LFGPATGHARKLAEKGGVQAGERFANEPAMPRTPRMFLPGMSHHVIHRGNNKTAIFHASGDFLFFLTLLRRATQAHDVAVNAYVLMSNHIHLIVTPSTLAGLSKAIQDVGRIYVQMFNDRYGRTGTLWEGRYRSSLIDDDRYFLTCHRYVEMNPVRAAMVERPDGYRWSSYGFHGLGHDDPLLTPHPLYLRLGSTSSERQTAWRALCGVPLLDDELADIRHPARPQSRVQSAAP
jgi:putative transposase